MKRALQSSRLAILLFFCFITISAGATVYPINVTLSGSQEVPANTSTGNATFVGTFNDATDSLIFTITFSGLVANTTSAHIHGPAIPSMNGPVLFPAVGFPTGVTSGTFTDTLVLTAGQRDTLKMGLYYFNIHSSSFLGGEIRAQLFLQDSTFAVPELNCIADTSANADAGVCSASLSFVATVSAGTPSPTFYYHVGNTEIIFPYVFPVGTTTVMVTALNAAGVDTCSFDVTVSDVEPPVVTCPADIIQSNDSGQCGAVVNYPDATATDNCSGVTITYSHPSGSFFAVGVNTVTVTATDDAGNSATCSFTITVNDTEPPVIHDLTTDKKVLWPPNHKLRNVMVTYTSTDNCPGPVTCSVTVLSNEPENGLGDGDTGPDWMVLNDHMVKLRAERSGTGSGRTYSIIVSCTDQYGNTGTDTTTVFVPKSLFSAYIRNLLHNGRFYNEPGSSLALNAEASKNAIILDENDMENLTMISAYPNPSKGYFNLNIYTTNDTEKISVRLIDMSGRVVEVRNNISGSQLLKVGDNLKAGIYIAEIRQGSVRKSIKLLKQE